MVRNRFFGLFAKKPVELDSKRFEGEGMPLKSFQAQHLSAHRNDFDGNGEVGRYVLLPGSNERAAQIAEFLIDVAVREHPRGHHLYLGQLYDKKRPIDVAVISSGMGCASMEIILHELIMLGAKRFLRVGTAGSLQPLLVDVGDLVNVSGAVRDEATTIAYVPQEVPALASLPMVNAIARAGEALQLDDRLHTGLAHCKSALYAREMNVGPQATDNTAYLHLLSRFGVLASEMETATLFIQTQYHDHLMQLQNQSTHSYLLAGAILGIISVAPDHFAADEQIRNTTDSLIELALQTVKELSRVDQDPYKDH